MYLHALICHTIMISSFVLLYLFHCVLNNTSDRIFINVCSYFRQEYERALKYADGILKVQPNNHQVQDLKTEINKRMKKGNVFHN